MKCKYLESVLVHLDIDKKSLKVEESNLSKLEKISKEYFMTGVDLSESERLRKEGYGSKTLVVGTLESTIETPFYALAGFCALPLIVPIGMGYLTYKITNSEKLAIATGFGLYVTEIVLGMKAADSISPSIPWYMWSLIGSAVVWGGGFVLAAFGIFNDINIGECYKKVRDSYKALMINRRKFTKEKLEKKIKLYLKELGIKKFNISP